MKAAHFVNWFCRGENCHYNQESQESAALKDRAILEAQRTGEEVDAVLGRLSTIGKSYHTPPPSHVQHSLEPPHPQKKSPSPATISNRRLTGR
jgi:hypothetical protein